MADIELRDIYCSHEGGKNCTRDKAKDPLGNFLTESNSVLVQNTTWACQNITITTEGFGTSKKHYYYAAD